MADDGGKKDDDKSGEDDKESAFFALMDKWADNREANKGKPKTNAQQKSILDALFG